MTRVRNNNGTLRSNNKNNDPAWLLARGYTARHIGAVLHNSTGNSIIHPLTAQEMEHDFQHICAYQDAATRYHQITYATTNRLWLEQQQQQQQSGTANANGGTSSIVLPTEPLPVKIDPDQEQRVAAQRKRMQRAEAVREEVEQQYVALRAHYVRTTQQLQQVSDASLQTIECLQRTVSNLARAMGLQRVRLQIVRDVLAALRVRNQTENGGAAVEPPENNNTPCPMTALWNQLEDDLRNVCWMQQKKPPPTSTRKSSSKTQSLPWHSTQEPSTIQGVPQLVSNISTVPDKSIGITTSGTFGALPTSLWWFESHLPSKDDDDDDAAALDATNAALRTEAAALAAELHKERQLNQTVLDDSAHARNQHDQWVAMISLVRQETEAVIHRHNVLLESDEVQKALPPDAGSVEEGDDEEEDDVEEEEALDTTAADKVVDAVPPAAGVAVDEEANEADDEGMVEDEEESETNKRTTEEESGPRKRRKL